MYKLTNTSCDQVINNTSESSINSTNIITNIVNINDSISSNNDYLLSQIILLKENINSLTNELTKLKIHNHYLNDYINNIMDNHIDNTGLCGCKNRLTSSNSVLYTETNVIHEFIVPESVCIMFVTMVGGGGAGGIGCYDDQYYYSGGGGGAGACYIKKPIFVTPCTKIYIKVGMGGNINNDCCGQDTYIEYTYCNETIKLVVCGGKNGNCDISIINKKLNGISISVNGGSGGQGIQIILNGNNGEPGQVSPPSNPYMSLTFNIAAGRGGNSIMNIGGKGGSNYFSSGGLGGNNVNFIGQDGQFGSGGGGSAPRMNIDCSMKLSGNGGNGLVILEY